MPSQPPAAQTHSRLLQLPAEVRMLILEHLLVADNAIETRETYADSISASDVKTETGRDSKGRFVRKIMWVTGFKIYPALLATCQALLLEGRPLLYEQNSLVIYLSCLRLHDLPPAGTNYPSHLSRPGSYAVRIPACGHAGLDFPNDALGRWVKQFQRFQLKIYLGDDSITFRIYNELLNPITPLIARPDSFVTVNFEFPELDNRRSKKAVIPYMRAFNVMRCKHLRFHGLSSGTGEEERVVRTVTGHESVHDLWSLTVKLRYAYSILLAIFDERKDRLGRVWAEEKYESIETSAKFWDITNLHMYRTEFLKRLEVELASWMSRMRDDDP